MGSDVVRFIIWDAPYCINEEHMNTNTKSWQRLFMRTHNTLMVRITMREIQSTKSYTILFVSVMLIGVLIFSIAAWSSVNTQITIGTTGTLGSSVYANSGTIDDIQAAVDAVVAAGGGIVYIPEGDWSDSYSTDRHVTSYGGVNLIGAGSDKTRLFMSQSASENVRMFYIYGQNGEPFRISGIGFYGYDDGYKYSGIYMQSGKDFRIDHCYFTHMGEAGIRVAREDYPTSILRGVIDHCEFDEMTKETIIVHDISYGVACDSSTDVSLEISRWGSIDDYLGKYTNRTIFIEDNIFKVCRHAIVGWEASHYVARHNTFTNYPTTLVAYQIGACDVHGAYTTGPLSGRCSEVYDNVFLNPDTNPYYNNNTYGEGTLGWERARAWQIRGGGGVFFNNEIHDMHYAVWFVDTEMSGNAVYPQCIPDDIWIWNNTMYESHGYPTSLIINGYSDKVVLDTNYYVSEKSGYTHYPYPHPLTLE